VLRLPLRLAEPATPQPRRRRSCRSRRFGGYAPLQKLRSSSRPVEPHRRPDSLKTKTGWRASAGRLLLRRPGARGVRAGALTESVPRRFRRACERNRANTRNRNPSQRRRPRQGCACHQVHPSGRLRLRLALPRLLHPQWLRVPASGPGARRLHQAPRADSRAERVALQPVAALRLRAIRACTFTGTCAPAPGGDSAKFKLKPKVAPPPVPAGAVQPPPAIPLGAAPVASAPAPAAPPKGAPAAGCFPPRPAAAVPVVAPAKSGKTAPPIPHIAVASEVPRRKPAKGVTTSASEGAAELVLIAAVAVVVLGGVGFFVYKKFLASPPPVAKKAPPAAPATKTASAQAPKSGDSGPTPSTR